MTIFENLFLVVIPCRWVVHYFNKWNKPYVSPRWAVWAIWAILQAKSLLRIFGELEAVLIRAQWLTCGEGCCAGLIREQQLRLMLLALATVWGKYLRG